MQFLLNNSIICKYVWYYLCKKFTIFLNRLGHLDNQKNKIEVELNGFSGYEIKHSKEVDDEITRIGPGTKAGEYLRRYWHPIFISSELADLPVAIKILGEELVLFRDKSKQLGLVHKHCPHRQASLEFGICQTNGISCCYHGWHFDVDGSILDLSLIHI